jgi:hypothetical protein
MSARKEKCFIGSITSNRSVKGGGEGEGGGEQLLGGVFGL